MLQLGGLRRDGAVVDCRVVGGVRASSATGCDPAGTEATQPHNNNQPICLVQATARRDPGYRRAQRAGHPGRDRTGHEQVSHPRAPGAWAKLCPRTIQSGPITRAGKTGRGNPYLKGALGEAAAAAAKTNTFLGERYRRIVKRRGKLKALVAVARSILVIVWHLLANPAARFRDLGADFHNNRIATERRLRNHIAQLTAMGYRVTIEPAA